MESLAQKRCVPCEAGTPPLSAEEAQGLMDGVPEWELVENKLQRRYRFRDFKAAIVFVNGVADIAESEGHHPDIHISWNRVRLELTTHAIKGLSENDFIMAAKLNELFEEERQLG